MSDENNKHNNEDEYQFPHEEYVAASTTPEPEVRASVNTSSADSMHATSSAAAKSGGMSAVLDRLPFLKNKKVVFGIIAAIVVFIAYNIMRTPSTKVIQAKPVSVVKKTPVVRTQPSLQVMDQMSRLQQDELNNQNTIKSLKNQLQQLQGSVSAANSAQSQINSNIVSVAHQVQQLSSEIQAMKVKPKKQAKKVIKAKPVTYHLRAATPGRAWVESSQGRATTVVVGTELKDYGKVKAINSQQGMVLTSSGKIIEYNNSGN